MLEAYLRTRELFEGPLLDWFLDNVECSQDGQNMMDRMVLTRDPQWALAMALRNRNSWMG